LDFDQHRTVRLALDEAISAIATGIFKKDSPAAA